MYKKKVILAMSGGVDSAVSAIILKKNGFYLEAAYMKNWEENDSLNFCSSKKDLKYVDYICKKLNIKLNILNFSYEYWNKVFIPFINKYKKNLVINPDILCNEKIKFDVFLNYSIKCLNFDFIATGHYANIINLKNDKFVLKTHLDKKKDQTYFLYNINRENLKFVLFPLAKYSKNNVRLIAKKYNLLNHNRKDSIGICFIGKKKFDTFINKYISNKPGNIVTIKNDIIGTHNGIFNYILGQRKGLKIGGNKKYECEPWYVVDKNFKTNELVVVQKKNNPLLFKDNVLIYNIFLIFKKNNLSKINCKAKIRHTYKYIKSKIIFLNKNICKVYFKLPQKGINPGQTIVFYKNSLCIGGGIISFF